MHPILKKIFDAGTTASYLFPGVGGKPINCKIIDLKTTRVTFRYKVGSKTFNIVTHPNNVVLIEKK